MLTSTFHFETYSCIDQDFGLLLSSVYEGLRSESDLVCLVIFNLSIPVFKLVHDPISATEDTGTRNGTTDGWTTLRKRET